MTTARGSILSVDFNGARDATVGATYTGNGVLRADGSTNDNPGVGTATGLWDGITFAGGPNAPAPSSGLLDSSGHATTTTLTLSGWTFTDDCPGCNYAHGDPNNQALLNDYIGVGSGNPVLTIGGLSANSPYNFISTAPTAARTLAVALASMAVPFRRQPELVHLRASPIRTATTTRYSTCFPTQWDSS